MLLLFYGNSVFVIKRYWTFVGNVSTQFVCFVSWVNILIVRSFECEVVFDTAKYLLCHGIKVYGELQSISFLPSCNRILSAFTQEAISAQRYGIEAMEHCTLIFEI